MEKKIVIFGASGGGAKVARNFRSLGIDIAFFLDNDRKKFGRSLEGSIIKDPDVLKDAREEYQIVIASMYHEEIKKQLIQAGIKPENIILKEQILSVFLEERIRFLSGKQEYQENKDRKKSIILDLVGGAAFGGIERWTLNLTDTLVKRNHDVTIFLSQEEANLKDNGSYQVLKLNIQDEQYIASIKAIADEIICRLPCSIIINRINQVFMAAVMIKKICADQLNIVSVIHSDFVRRYEQNELFHDSIDAVFCVSHEIKDKLLQRSVIPKDKIFYMNSPVPYEEYYKKHYPDANSPIRIGYGGRLEKEQKRADLLIPLIPMLEETEINYQLHIAGDGSLYETIKAYVQEQKLEHRVKLYGSLPYQQMYEFWKQSDIFINVSDMEGTSLSMLEAMASGAVPIVTDTSGARNFVRDGKNGFICCLKDIAGITDKIKLLYHDRQRLSEMGDASRLMIKDRCNIDQYTDLIERLLHQPQQEPMEM